MHLQNAGAIGVEPFNLTFWELSQMRNGAIRSQAGELAILASCFSGKRISANDLLPRHLRELPPPPTAEDYDRRAKAMGIKKTENH